MASLWPFVTICTYYGIGDAIEKRARARDRRAAMVSLCPLNTEDPVAVGWSPFESDASDNSDSGHRLTRRKPRHKDEDGTALQWKQRHHRLKRTLERLTADIEEGAYSRW